MNKKIIVYFQNMGDGSREVSINVNGKPNHLGVLPKSLDRWLWRWCQENATDTAGLLCPGLTAYGFRRVE